MIIELFGLPGSGKSYIASKLADELQKKNIKAFNVTSYLNDILAGKIMKKVLLSGIQLGFFEKKLYREIAEMLPRHELWASKFGIYESAEYPIDMITLILHMQKRETNDVVYIYDEGAIHSIVKMMADFELGYSVTEKLIEYVLKTIFTNDGIVVYNRATVEICIQSIKKRNRHVCTFDELSGDRLKGILKNYKKSCDKIAENSAVVLIDRNDDMKKVERIISKITVKE